MPRLKDKCRSTFMKPISSNLLSALKMIIGCRGLAVQHTSSSHESTEQVTACPKEYVLTSSDMMFAFIKEVNLWFCLLAKGIHVMFSQLLEIKNKVGYQKISSFIESHLDERHI